MKPKPVVAWIAAFALFATIVVSLMATHGPIFEPPYVDAELRNADDAPAICDGPAPTGWIRGRLVVEPGARLPARIERDGGTATFVLWPRGFRVSEAGLFDEHGVLVAAPGTEMSISGERVDGDGTAGAPYRLTFTHLGSGCYVFMGKWPDVASDGRTG